ncbi:MAG: hypothetical protein IJ789_03160 [Bacteroidales bacterium]|nr:hypothetical protein [Bacteroidales bacterium]
MLILLVSTLVASADDFGRWFDGRTLRVDYIRRGNAAGDTIELSRFVEKSTAWSGSRTTLIDPFDNGDYRVSMIDVESGRTVYTKCYNTLFREYRDTYEAKHQSREFEEVVNLPWPQAKTLIVFEKRDDRQRFVKQASFVFSPRETAVEHVQQSAQVRDLLLNGPSERKVDIVIVPEGYGPNDDRRMRDDLRRFADYIFGHAPFASRHTDFNVRGLLLLGDEEGVSNPALGRKVESALGSTYGVFGSDRYLMTFNLFRLHDLLDAVPFDYIVIMVGADKYGGGAIYNFYATVSTDRMAPLILTHELGHSIGGLADEYVDPDLSYNSIHSSRFEPLEPNITALIDFGAKWRNLVAAGVPIPTPDNDTLPPTQCGPVGCYEGAGYQATGIFRPTMHCMMRDYAPYCPVCSQRMNDIFDLYTK